MRDPFPIDPPAWMINALQPYADAVNLTSLPIHAHEVLFAFVLYNFVFIVVSPILSKAIIPEKYKNFTKRTRINWDVHVVSFFQSVLISILSLYIILFDEERKPLRERSRWEDRVWEYTGLGGLCQSFALGYFLWDFVICAYHLKIFGLGMLAHAISALSVFSLGYRPFIYFYAPVFLLYELSSPFLNIHWFCDKLELTGSTIQAVNGAFLVGTFFGCRLVWGNLSSIRVFQDIYKAIRYSQGQNISAFDFGAPKSLTANQLLSFVHDEQGQRFAFAGEKHMPAWLGLTYLASNLTLNSLNIYWFGKMVQTIRTRFDPPWGTKGVGPDQIHWEPQEKIAKAAKAAGEAIGVKTEKKGSVAAGRKKAEEALNEPIAINTGADIQRAEFSDGSKSVDITGSRSLRTRRKA